MQLFWGLQWYNENLLATDWFYYDQSQLFFSKHYAYLLF